MIIKEMLELKDKKLVIDTMAKFVTDELNEFSANGVIFGLSGGVDSSLVAFILAQVLPKDKIFAVFMGERDSHPQSRLHARLVVEKLGIDYKEIDLTAILKKIGVYSLEPSPLFVPRSLQEKYTLGKYLKYQDAEETTFLKSLKGGENIQDLMKGNAYIRIKHRLRAVLLYFYGEQRNYIVVGCCNKTEKLTGYFVKYGDSASDIDLIADLYKTQVKELARFLGVPREIIEKDPTPDLAPGLTDEFALQMPYDKVDKILYALQNNLLTELKHTGITEKEVDYIKKLNFYSENMRVIPPYPKVS